MSAELEIRAPSEQTEGTRSQILRWLKAVGERVNADEPLIEIETDKVTVEIASPGAGTLREILKQEQEEIEPGELLGRIERAGYSEATSAKLGIDAVPAALGTETGDTGAVGSQTTGEVGAAPRGSMPVGGGAASGAAQLLSPAVRRLLAERGLKASEVSGTGEGGRVTVADVMGHTGGPPNTGTSSPSSHSGAPGTPAGTSDSKSAPPIAGPGRSVPHTATRKRIAEHMVQSLLHTAPHVTTVFEADMSAVLQHRQRNKADFERRGAALTLTAYFLQATVTAMRAIPEANSRWTEGALEIFDSLHIGVATALETGLVVPVLRDVQDRDLFGIAKGLDELIARAREGRMSPADVRGGTFTISNHGVSGSIMATPIIINQPQSAILGVGKLEKRAVVVSNGAADQIVVQPRCYVTLTIDHRVMDGHQANRFLQTFVERLAKPD